MTRRLNNNPIFQNFYFIIFLIVILLIFIFTVGFKILLNTSVFIANIFSNNKPTETIKNTNEFLSLTIDNIPSATNSASIIVSGSATNIDEIQFVLNNKKIKEIKNFSLDSFNEEISGLVEGENQIYLIGKNNNDNITKKTQKYTVIYKNTKPKLEIIDPKDGDTVNKNEIIIKGETDKEVFVKINNSPVIVDALGKFQYQIRLNEGENSFEIIAQDIAGNIETKTLKINYQKD